MEIPEIRIIKIIRTYNFAGNVDSSYQVCISNLVTCYF